MICIVDENNKITNIINKLYPTENNERQYYPWNRLLDQYTDVEPFDYAKNRYIKAAGAEFAKRRDAIRFIDVGGVTYGFDCASDDITNFMAAYTPLMLNQDGETVYKVWLDKDKKGLVMFSYAGMKKAYDTVRSSQLAAYAWYEDIKAKLIAVTEAEGKEKLEEIYPMEG